ncbi:hypothetical protein [Oxalobacter formigenes]|uniref:hypothetical protein n=1 Tax=Oxalobacter formigenes TaxID=847 RepID=UPI000A2A348E|nr:hypothetical protein [Oxalobacter formigenes]ARQ46715.1 hypothetical protein BRW83_1976 [Oxalobacter formigenes]MCZ4062617.1 hypothetical protein [Oxalobacter formigenes]WAW01206.1 hypothetical protein NB644_09685 [Oxalobacter formigenes]WAW03534.1 hypothetical protein NB642_10455 [Oxalobacter formigenes]
MKIKDWLMDQQQDEPMSEDEEYTPPADGGDITTAVQAFLTSSDCTVSFLKNECLTGY